MCLKESSKAREAWCCKHLKEWRKETGGEWGGGTGVWSLRCYLGSDVYQSKHQNHSCVVPLTSLAYLWIWDFFFFFFLPHPFPFFLFSFSFSFSANKFQKPKVV